MTLHHDEEYRGGTGIIKHDAPVAERPVVTLESIHETTHQLKILTAHIPTLLQKGIDYGRPTGQQSDSLWDPGAAMIISFFNAYPGNAHVLHMVDTDELISVCLEVPLISFKTGRIISTGCGAASTKEVKYKYRWVEKYQLKDYGFDSEVGLKVKTKDNTTKYQIPNPERGDLLNTMVKMARKRAEQDAAQALPGVATALKMLFDGKKWHDPTPIAPKTKAESPKAKTEPKPDWNHFWGELSKLELGSEQVHRMLGVGSLNDWISAGKTLDDALAILRGQVGQAHAATVERDVASIKTLTDLNMACFTDFGLQPNDVARELGYSSYQEIPEPFSTAYLTIKEIYRDRK